jgi:hypothetical protein
MLTINFMVPDYVLGRQEKSLEENAFSSIQGLLVNKHGRIGAVEILFEVSVAPFSSTSIVYIPASWTSSIHVATLLPVISKTFSSIWIHVI